MPVHTTLHTAYITGGKKVITVIQKCNRSVSFRTSVFSRLLDIMMHILK